MFEHVKMRAFMFVKTCILLIGMNMAVGLKKKNTFIEFSKGFIDNIHAWYTDKRIEKQIFNSLTESIYGLHFYDSMLIIEKRKISQPEVLFKGTQQNEKHVEAFGQKKNIENDN